MKRVLLGILAAAVMLFTLFLSACGIFLAGGGSGVGDEVDSSIFELDPNKEYSIEFMMWGAANEVNNYKALVREFRKIYPNITVKVSDNDPSIYMQVLQGRLSGTMPDVFYLPEYEFNVWADSGRLLNITSGLNEEELEAMWDTAIDWYSFNRKTRKLGRSEGSSIYALPKDIGPWTLAYNKDIINECLNSGVLTQDDVDLLSPDTPMTWQQFSEICVKIQQYKSGVQKNPNFYAIPYYEFWTAVWSSNADFFTENAMESRITEDNFIKAVEWLWDLQKTYKVMPVSTGDNAQSMFLAGNCAFCWVGPYLTMMYWQEEMNYDLIPVPYNGEVEGAKSTTWIGTLGIAISQTTKSPAAALALVKFLSMNEDAQRDFYQRGQLMPNLKWMAESEDEYLSSTSDFGKKNPLSRRVYIDIVDGFRDENDLIGGRVRPHYWTFQDTWNISLINKVNELFLMNSKSGFKAALEEYNTTFQSLLDQSNASAGIYR